MSEFMKFRENCVKLDLVSQISISSIVFFFRAKYYFGLVDTHILFFFISNTLRHIGHIMRWSYFQYSFIYFSGCLFQWSWTQNEKRNRIIMLFDKWTKSQLYNSFLGSCLFDYTERINEVHVSFELNFKWTFLSNSIYFVFKDITFQMSLYM